MKKEKWLSKVDIGEEFYVDAGAYDKDMDYITATDDDAHRWTSAEGTEVVNALCQRMVGKWAAFVFYMF